MQDDPRHNRKPQEVPEVLSGLRMTKQRQEVYRILLEERTHPTANEVYLRVKGRLPQISLATVYNCLEAMVLHGVVKQVHYERESSRYCPNLTEHGHFYDSSTGMIHDVDFKPGTDVSTILNLPPGAVVEDVEITIRGKIVS